LEFFPEFGDHPQLPAADHATCVDAIACTARHTSVQLECSRISNDIFQRGEVMKRYTHLCRVFGFPSLVVVLTFSLLGASTAAFCDPIHDAARKGDLKKVKALIAADPKIVNDRDNNGDTPLHQAALHNQFAVAQALIEAGADVNAKNSYGAFTPDDLNGILVSSNHKDPVSLLTVHGVDASDMKNGYTPLHLAEFSVGHKKMIDLLVSKGADVNARAASGATPLFFAILRDQKDDAQYLISKGANVNIPDAYGDTVLDCALRLQYGSLIQLLLDSGADVNAQDQSMHRPLTYALGMDDHHWADVLRKRGAHE
jgi:ankyrin repeat protein